MRPAGASAKPVPVIPARTDCSRVRNRERKALECQDAEKQGDDGTQSCARQPERAARRHEQRERRQARQRCDRPAARRARAQRTHPSGRGQATTAAAASAAASVRRGNRPRLWPSAVTSIAVSFCFTIVDEPIAGHQGHRGIRGGELRISQTGVLQGLLTQIRGLYGSPLRVPADVRSYQRRRRFLRQRNGGRDVARRHRRLDRPRLRVPARARTLRLAGRICSRRHSNQALGKLGATREDAAHRL